MGVPKEKQWILEIMFSKAKQAYHISFFLLLW